MAPMTASGVTFDVEGLALVWARNVPGLVGVSSPLIGIHLTDDARSPGKGAIASLRVGSSSVDMEGLGHSAAITFEVKAIGGEGGAKKQAWRGAAALATALRELTGTPVLVTSDGVTAKLSHVERPQGPLFAGTPNGQSTYRVDGVFVFQSA